VALNSRFLGEGKARKIGGCKNQRTEQKGAVGKTAGNIGESRGARRTARKEPKI